MRVSRTKALLYGASIPAILLASGYAWLVVVGFPGPVLRRVQQFAQSRHLHVEARSFRLSPNGGLRLDRVRACPAQPSAFHEIAAARVDIQLNLRDLLHLQVTVREIRFDGARIMSTPSTASAMPSWGVSSASGSLIRVPSGIRIKATGRGTGIPSFRIEGTVESEFSGPVSSDWGDRWSRVSAVLDAAGTTTASRLKSLPDPVSLSSLDASFVIRVNAGGSLSGTGTLRISRALAFGMVLDDWTTRMVWNGSRVDTLSSKLRIGDDETLVEGWCDATTRRLSLTGSGAVPGALVLRMLEAWLPWPNRTPPHPVLSGPVHFRLETGEADWMDALNHVSGQVHCESPFYLWGVTGTRLRTTVERRDGWLQFRDIEILTGDATRPGPITGQFAYCPDTRDFHGEARAEVDPALLLPLLRPGESLYIGAVRALDTLPRFNGSFSGRIGDVDRLVVTAHIAGTNVLYSGLPMVEAEFDLNVSRQIARFENLRIRMPDGEFNGNVVHDFARHRADFQVVSSLSPYAIGRILGPQIHRFVHLFRFEGPVHLAGDGFICYHTPVTGALHLELQAESAGMDWALADSLACSVTLQERHLTFSDIRARFLGGDLTGQADLDLPGAENEPSRYAFSGVLKEADLAGLLLAVAPTSKEKYQGVLNAELTMRGAIGEGQGPTVTGEGNVNVRNGQLTSLAVFGGLSKALSSLSPGLGYLSQTGLKGSFRIGNSRIRSEDLKVTGSILSMKATGEVGFDQSLKFIIQAQLLRKGLAAETLRLLTFPVTKLLELELNGTLQNPEWKTRNLSR